MDDFRLGNGTKAFTDYNNQFVDSNRKTVQEQKDYIFSIANQCRGWYLPEFADDHKYMPVSKPVVLEKKDDGEIVEVPIVQVGELNASSPTNTSAQYLTVPPDKKDESDKLLQYVLIGIGAIVVYKLFLT